jgi:hypothetical protein
MSLSEWSLLAYLLVARDRYGNEAVAPKGLVGVVK